MPVYAEMSDASTEKDGGKHSSSQHKNESPQESSPSILIWPASLLIILNLSDLGIECSSLAAAAQRAQRLSVT